MSIAVLSWTWRRVLRSPLAWLVVLASMAAVPVLELASPVGLTTRDGRPGAWLGGVLTATALAGAVFAIEGLAEARDLLRRQRAAARVQAGLTIAWSEFIFTVPTLFVSSIYLSAAQRTPLAAELVAAALTIMHVAALAWFLALLPIPDGLRSILLVFLAWLLAGWISTAGIPTASFSILVDVTQASRIDLGAASWGARIAVVAPIIVLVGACLLIYPARDPSP